MKLYFIIRRCEDRISESMKKYEQLASGSRNIILLENTSSALRTVGALGRVNGVCLKI
jgi:hypothetical protein